MKFIWGFFSFILMAQASAFAQASSLDVLFEKLMEDPTNLELNFEYANTAIKEGELDTAMATYERMLIVNPELARIKLDLAALHVQLGNFELAKELFSEVIETDPPANVIANINTMLKRIKEQQKSHFFSGSFGLSYHTDSNANSASSTGEVLFNGIELPLDDASQSQQDDARTMIFSFQHRYAFNNQSADMWQTNYSHVVATQSNISALDLKLHSISTGPIFNIPTLGISLNSSIGYNFIELGQEKYQESLIVKLGLDKQISEKLLVSTAISGENRHYFNSDSNPTVSERNGDAIAWLLDIKYALTPKDLLAASYKFQRDATRRGYYSNNQNSLNFSYTRLFTPSLFAAVNFYIKTTDYKNVDAFIDTSTIREDTERGSGITVGKTFGKLTTSLGYTWKDVNSNIKNYTYDNERISANLGWRF